MSSFADHRIIVVSLFLPTSIAASFNDTNTASTSEQANHNAGQISSAEGASSTATGGPSSQLSPQNSPTATKFPTNRPTHKRHGSSINIIKQQAPASIVDDLLAQKSAMNATSKDPTGMSALDEEEEEVTPRKESSNPFASFVSNDQERAEIARGRDRGDVQMDTSRDFASTSEGSTRVRRLSRKQSKGAGALSITRDVSVGPWEIETNPNANGGLHNAVMSVAGEMQAGRLWVGVLGPETDDIPADMRTSIETQMKRSDSVPVWVSDANFSGCYDSFCHQVLWPSLHYIVPDAPKTKATYESSSFVQYKAVNEAFADTIVKNYKEGDIIWVNDYHLMLLPQMIRARLPHAAISFFLHVAFPSSEIFRCLAARESLLHGMLGADLIGFQTHSYARHFRQTVSRILSVEATPKGIQLLSSTGLNEIGSQSGTGAGHNAKEHGHPKTILEKAAEELSESARKIASEHDFVDVAVFPLGIDVQTLTRRRQEKEVGEWITTLRERYKGMKLIVARDKLDEVQGVRQKFLGFERFLEQNPEFHGKVTLIQVALSTTIVNELQGNVTDVISRINMKFSTLTYQPIVFFHTHDVTFSQYLALLTVADCFIVTSLREGMALRTHEYVECQTERQRPLILSEFTGSFSFSGFRSCLAINPWDIQMTADAIKTSLTMPAEEAAWRWKELHDHVNAQTAQAFTSSFLNRTVRVHYKHHIKDSLVILTLDPDKIRGRYSAEGDTKRRLILLDLERTLWPHDPSPPPQSSEVPEETIKLLERLTADERNEVWGLSGLSVEGKLETVASRVPNLGICAEHGCYMRPRGSSEWIAMTGNMNMAWMPACIEILQYFTERTPHSFIDKRHSTIVWRFAQTEDEGDRSWARRQAAEAQNHIYDSLGERFRLRIIPSLTSFIVLPKVLGRSTAVASILQTGGISAAASHLDTIAAPSQQWPTSGMNVDQYSYILAVGADGSLMNKLKRVKNAETIYTGPRKTGGSNWRCEAEDIYAAFNKILA